MKAPMTKHQLPNNDQMTNDRMSYCSSLIIDTWDLVITTEGRL